METTDYTADLAAGEITFTTAPGTGVDITADYTAGYDPTVIVAPVGFIHLGLQVANVGAESAALTMRVNDIRQCKGTPIGVGASLNPIAGKLVLLAGDVLQMSASADDMLELTLSYMEV